MVCMRLLFRSICCHLLSFCGSSPYVSEPVMYIPQAKNRSCSNNLLSSLFWPHDSSSSPLPSFLDRLLLNPLMLLQHPLLIHPHSNFIRFGHSLNLLDPHIRIIIRRQVRSLLSQTGNLKIELLVSVTQSFVELSFSETVFRALAISVATSAYLDRNEEGMGKSAIRFRHIHPHQSLLLK